MTVRAESRKRRHTRSRTRADLRGTVPVHVVWELTLACNLKCRHCGSRAGRPRSTELSTRECIEVVEQLADLGTREITLIGGEAYLRRDWLEILSAIREHGIYCALQTGARALTDQRLQSAVTAGLQGLGVSIDGLPSTHDEIRGFEGSFDAAISALERAKALGLATSVNTVIGAPNFRQLPDLMARIVEAGASQWQIQLAVAMGNAVDHPELLLQPYELLELMPLLGRLYHEGQDQGLLLLMGNNIGYFGPFEHLWRNHSELHGHWAGCSAGQTVIGLEADGTMKGCPSLATATYSGGNVRDLGVEKIWNESEELHFGRLSSASALWGFCRSCYYAEVCRAGCTWTADSLFGRPGNNPYCHHRALELEARGLRERVVKVRDAEDSPFAVGEFKLVREPIQGRDPALSDAEAPLPSSEEPTQLVQIGRQRLRGVARSRGGRVPPRLEVCRSCNRHVFAGEETCPHCQGDIAVAAAKFAEDHRRRMALVAKLEGLMGSAQGPSAS